jgi:hypothetical protein
MQVFAEVHCGHVHGYMTGGSVPQACPGKIEAAIEFMHASYRFLF